MAVGARWRSLHTAREGARYTANSLLKYVEPHPLDFAVPRGEERKMFLSITDTQAHENVEWRRESCTKRRKTVRLRHTDGYWVPTLLSRPTALSPAVGVFVAFGDGGGDDDDDAAAASLDPVSEAILLRIALQSRRVPLR